MKTTTTSKKISMHVRLDKKVKRDAQMAAKSINLPLSSIINNYLYYFGKHKDVAFEYPSPKLVATIKEIEKDIKMGKVSKFTNVDDAIAWLKK
ncbi:MAG: hypothetical protein NUW00_01710 [Candidatus Kaiserbacteria bacterium]|nr:hypothetical protein [Candidatus Kaiserbacteria bacterium]